MSELRPRIGLSKCLEMEACRHDGAMIRDEFVRRLEAFVDLVPVCPEVGIGLGVPRDTIRLVADGLEAERLVRPSDGADLSEPMREFSAEWIGAMPPLDGFMFKGRSPTCGPGDVRVYAGIANSPVARKAPGLFAGAIQGHQPWLPAEDEGRLRNFRIRDHFLIRIYALARLRTLGEAPTMGAIVSFHAQHKLLLLVYHQERMRELGRVVANHEGAPTGDVYARYADGFRHALVSLPKRAAHVNALQHALGHFSDQLGDRERKQFLLMLDGFRDSRLPLAAPVMVVRSWCERFDYGYLRDQLYLEPYPPELVEMRDSGKGIDF